MATITYDGVTTRYPHATQAVRELDLAIRDGEWRSSQRARIR